MQRSTNLPCLHFLVLKHEKQYPISLNFIYKITVNVKIVWLENGGFQNPWNPPHVSIDVNMIGGVGGLAAWD